MSYTPTQWNTGDTITASALNKIEQGIANAGGGNGIDGILYIDADNNTAIYGDFASAVTKLASGIPICVINCANGGNHSSGIFQSGIYPAVVGWKYMTSSPNQIGLYTSSSSGYIWTANGVTYWD